MSIAGRAAAGKIAFDEMRLALGFLWNRVARKPGHSRVALIVIPKSHRDAGLIARDDDVWDAVWWRTEVGVKPASAADPGNVLRRSHVDRRAAHVLVPPVRRRKYLAPRERFDKYRRSSG